MHDSKRKILILYSFVFLMICLLRTDGSAHEKHKESQSQQTKQGLQTLPSANQPQSKIPPPESEVEAKPLPMPFSGSMKEHAHNKLVHLPLGFGLAGVLFVFISLKKPEMLTAVRILWFLAALGAIGAYFTGEAQEEPFEDGALREVVGLHKNLGIATGISFGIGFLLSWSRRLKGLTVVWAILVLALVSVTGYYGGILAHS